MNESPLYRRTRVTVYSHELANWARPVKSDAELVDMREAGRLIRKEINEGHCSD